MKRRKVLKYLSILPVSSVVQPKILPLAVEKANIYPGDDLFEELGVRTFLNAAGTYTGMTGSLMREETLEAIRNSSTHFCMLSDLQDKVGAQIAKIVHAEYAMVTSGCFSALTLGLAGVMTGKDDQKIRALPHLAGTGIKSEVICQKGHNVEYSRALTNTGCKIIPVETAEDVEKAINERTAMLFFINLMTDNGKIKQEEWLALAKKHQIPTMIDIAADVPPVSNLWKFNDMGFDLVCISGGKAMRGPQSAGILMGKRPFIEAARLNTSPHGDTIGRGMKVNKEEIFGMYLALKTFVKQDHEAEFRKQQQQVDTIKKEVLQVSKGITAEVVVPKYGNVTPTLHLAWDARQVRASGKDIQTRLREGTPSIEIASSETDKLVLTVWMLKAGEEKIVAQRLKEELQKGG